MYVIKLQTDCQKGSAWIPGMLTNILEPENKTEKKLQI